MIYSRFLTNISPQIFSQVDFAQERVGISVVRVGNDHRRNSGRGGRIAVETHGSRGGSLWSIESYQRFLSARKRRIIFDFHRSSHAAAQVKTFFLQVGCMYAHAASRNTLSNLFSSAYHRTVKRKATSTSASSRRIVNFSPTTTFSRGNFVSPSTPRISPRRVFCPVNRPNHSIRTILRGNRKRTLA